MICRYHSKEDSFSTTVSFWSIYEGQWGREILPKGKSSSSASGCSFCLKEEMARDTSLYCFMGFGLWFGWMVRNLEGI